MFKDIYNTVALILPAVIITYFASNLIDRNYELISNLRQQINELQENCDYKLVNKISYKVTVTTYNPTRAQCDDTPNITADGTKFHTWKASSYRYVALSRDLLSRWGGPFNYGDYIVIEGTGDRDGVYQVRDTMNPKWTNRVDILTTNSRFKYNNITMYKYVDEEYLVYNN
jgi:3D (Asp-Asp-Asp) domain-containing protein